MRMRMGMGIVAMLSACSGKDRDRPPKDFSNPAAPAQPAPQRFALSDFTALRYLEGAWKGSMANGSAFFESYHFADDSTLLEASYTDSTFATRKDSARIMLRDGAVSYSGGSTYAAEKLDSTMVDFRASPLYHFTWTRESNDAWKATLYSKQADGSERITVYSMTRIRR